MTQTLSRIVWCFSRQGHAHRAMNERGRRKEKKRRSPAVHSPRWRNSGESKKLRNCPLKTENAKYVRALEAVDLILRNSDFDQIELEIQFGKRCKSGANAHFDQGATEMGVH